MVIEFYKNTPRQKFFRLGVIGNNLTDTLVFIIERKQGSVDLSDFEPYIKIVSKDMTYADKTKYFTVDDSNPEKIKLAYLVPSKVTNKKNVDMQIVFEKAQDGDDPITWQTVIFNIQFDFAIDVSEVIESEYPDILNDFEKRISSLESGSAAAIQEYATRADFPETGISNVIYRDAEAGDLYLWYADTNSYGIIGYNPDDITIINGNGGN